MKVGDVSRIYCRECKKDTNSEALCVYSTDEKSEDGEVWVSDDYYIVRCCGCDYVSFLHENRFSEDWEMGEDPMTGEDVVIIPTKQVQWPPKTGRARPNWHAEIIEFDMALSKLFDELYICLDNDAHVLAAVGIRTIFDRITETCGVDAELPFARKLDDLVTKSQISNTERTSLEILVEAGGAAAHRGWRPDIGQLNAVVQILEHFAERILVLQKKAPELRGSIPKRGAKSSTVSSNSP